MKPNLRTLADVLLVALAIVGVLMFVHPMFHRHQGDANWGCAPVVDVGGEKVACALPATYEELAKAFVCVCPKAGKGPVGSGVFIGAGIGDRLKVCLVTARLLNVAMQQRTLRATEAFLFYKAEARILHLGQT